MNPRMSVAMAQAIEKIKKGVSVAAVAREHELWPQSIYLALKREGVQSPGRNPRRTKKGGNR